MDDPVTKETVQRWTPPPVTREVATVQTAISLSLPHPNLRAANEASRRLLDLPLTIAPARSCEAFEVLDSVAVIIERVSGERMAVALGEPVWHAVLAALLGPAPRTNVPLEAERGALLYIAGQLVHAALGNDFYVAGITTTAASLCEALGLANTRDAPWCARATIALGDSPGNAALFCATPFAATPAAVGNRGRLANVPVPCAITCGEVSLRTSELRAVVEGDVVLLDRFGIELDKRGLNGCVRLAPLEGAAMYWECVMHDGELTLNAMQPDNPTPPTHADLHDLPIRLHVELARLSMTVGELESLRVGQVVRLAQSTGDPATLSAGAHPIATGEVVDVEGELGFRITKLETHPGDGSDAA